MGFFVIPSLLRGLDYRDRTVPGNWYFCPESDCAVWNIRCHLPPVSVFFCSSAGSLLPFLWKRRPPLARMNCIRAMRCSWKGYTFQPLFCYLLPYLILLLWLINDKARFRWWRNRACRIRFQVLILVIWKQEIGHCSVLWNHGRKISLSRLVDFCRYIIWVVNHYVKYHLWNYYNTMIIR